MLSPAELPDQYLPVKKKLGIP